MLLLALSKRTVQMDQLTRAGQFKERNTYKTIELKGATVGIIGMGKISRLGGEEASPGFEMNILATDPYVKQAVSRDWGSTMAHAGGSCMQSPISSSSTPLCSPLPSIWWVRSSSRL